MSDPVWVSVPVRGRVQRIECVRLRAHRVHRPLLVFLHEGLGSVAMWRDAPQALCEAADCRGLVYSRPGYGRSSPRPPHERWSPEFMHEHARGVLPALLQALGESDRAGPICLIGHSDGGSIALIHAATPGSRVSGVIALAPHILVEDVTLRSIAAAREAYLRGGLRARLARYHDDPDSAFWGWNDVWLSPAFRHWSIENELSAIRCPVLAIQGIDDEYGTLEQVRGIVRRVSDARCLELPECGHAPHRDRPGVLTRAVLEFLNRLTLDQPAPV